MAYGEVFRPGVEYARWPRVKLLPMGDVAESRSSSPVSGEGYQDVLQSVVFRKLGRCLIRLQQYELLIKDFVARARVEGPADSIAAMYAVKEANISQQTLGMVVGTFLDTVLNEPAWDADGFPPTAASGEKGAWFSSGFTMTFADEELEGVKAAMTDLVALRNALVHGFVGQHDLQTEAGCLAATTTLDHAEEVIDKHFQELRESYTGMLDLSRAMEGMLNNPELSDHFFLPVSPDHADVDGPASTTVLELLRHAEVELSLDGWTPLDDAVALIRLISPEHTPGRYGCSTWRQVLHESRPIFIVRREAGDPQTRGRTWYQSRSPQAIERAPES